MRYNAIPLFLLLATHVSLQEGGFHPDQQRAIIERSGDYTLRLRREGANLSVAVAKGGRLKANIVLPSEVAQVDRIDLVAANKAAILGAVNGDVSAVVVLDLDKFRLVDKFYCYAPALSPDKRFLAFIKFFPAHFVDGVSDVYLYYDFQKSPADNRPTNISKDDVQNIGQPIYPAGSKNQRGDNTDQPESQIHTLESGRFFWAPKEDRLAFVDQFRGKVSLVTALFPESGAPVKVKELEIRKSDVCSSIEIEQCTFGVTSIQFTDQEHLKLKLRSNNDRYPVRNEIDLNM